MKKRALLIIATGLIIGLNTANAQDNQKGKGAEKGKSETKGKSEGNDDKKFLTMALASNNYEIQAANLAIEKATNPQVKDYAKMMLEFHSKSAKELSSMMRAKGVEEKKELTGEEKANLDELRNKTGKEFDAAYSQQMVKSHRKAMSTYESSLKSTKDADVKNHINASVPVIKKHLESAQKLQAQK
jgi:putative membrane protein